MHDFLKEQYQFSDYQIAQLQYLVKTLASEFSKLLIMAFLFRNQLDIYASAVAVMLLMRTSTGGLHCKKYFSCFLVSLSYMLLSIMVLPNLPVNKVFQLILLFLCMLCNYWIGPVTSSIHRPLSERCIRRVRLQAFILVFLFLTVIYIIPDNPCITAGFWVIILHTLQLIAAKILKKKGEFYEKQVCEDY